MSRSTLPPPTRPEYILVVDDLPGVQKGIIRIFQQAGYGVTGADSYDGAVYALRNWPGKFHILLTDGEYPGADPTDLRYMVNGGTDILRYLKKNPSQCPPCIVVYSSRATQMQDEIAALGAAAVQPQRFLEKPLSGEDLLRQVREACLTCG